MIFVFSIFFTNFCTYYTNSATTSFYLYTQEVYIHLYNFEWNIAVRSEKPFPYSQVSNRRVQKGISRNFPSQPLFFEPPRLSKFKKISSFIAYSPTQMKFFPSSPLLLEPTRLSNLDKNSSLPFYQSLLLYQIPKSNCFLKSITVNDFQLALSERAS